MVIFDLDSLGLLWSCIMTPYKTANTTGTGMPAGRLCFLTTASGTVGIDMTLHRICDLRSRMPLGGND